MAVQDKYTDSKFSGSVLSKLQSMVNVGSNMSAAFATFEVAAADDDASIYRVFKGLDPNIVPIAILVACDALTGGTDWDLGLYRTNLGAVVIKDVFMDGQTLATAVDFGFDTCLDGMDNIAIENYGRKLYEHAGHAVDTKLEAYDLAFTANTVGTAAGTVAILFLYLQG